MKNNTLIRNVRDYAIVTIGVLLVAFGIQYFYIPNDIAGGGLSGLALVINHYIPYISPGNLVLIGNLVLFIISFILVGGDFGFKTIYASFLLSFMMNIMDKYFAIPPITTNLLFAVIWGTLTTSFGLAMAFAINASTGGTDILAKILNKYTNFNIGRALLIVDLFVVVCGAITFGLNKGLFSLLAVIANGLLIDKYIELITKYKENKAASKDTEAEQVS